MKEYPVIFSTVMVQAILEGRKNQTRRIVKHQQFETIWFDDECASWCGSNKKDFVNDSDSPVIKCPYGQIGDVLWVRESFADLYEEMFYKADDNSKRNFPNETIKWSPSIHMRRSDARIFLKIENIRVERVQEISKEDAKAEGMNVYQQNADGRGRTYIFNDAREHFEFIWNKINGKRASWESNPWVWVIEFSRYQPENIDAISDEHGGLPIEVSEDLDKIISD